MEQAASLGLHFDKVPNIGFGEGIEAARLVFPRVWFDRQKCEKGVQARQEIPVGRFAKPSEIAAAAAYLASEDAGIINGETLMADGGFTIR